MRMIDRMLAAVHAASVYFFGEVGSVPECSVSRPVRAGDWEPGIKPPKPWPRPPIFSDAGLPPEKPHDMLSLDLQRTKIRAMKQYENNSLARAFADILIANCGLRRTEPLVYGILAHDGLLDLLEMSMLVFEAKKKEAEARGVPLRMGGCDESYPFKPTEMKDGGRP